MAEFNADLYEFLKENETHMYLISNTLEFGVHIYFSDLKDFIQIIGSSHLDDGGIETTLNSDSTLFVPLNDVFDNDDLSVYDYRYCFPDEDIERYKEIIKGDLSE